MYQTVRYEKNDKIGVLTISRPAALNALNSLELGEIDAVIAQVEADAELGCLIITGEGKGDEKLAWVEAQLRQCGYNIDRYAIEAAVKEMNDKSLTAIAEELGIPGEEAEKTEDE